jgi:hypothetical protein
MNWCAEQIIRIDYYEFYNETIIIETFSMKIRFDNILTISK